MARLKITTFHFLSFLKLFLAVAFLSFCLMSLLGIFSPRVREVLRGAALEQGEKNNIVLSSNSSDAFMNRAGLMKLIVVALGFQPHHLGNAFCFSDVQDEWFAQYVCFAKRRGLLDEFEGKFEPAKGVTFLEAEKIIVQAFGLNLDGKYFERIVSNKESFLTKKQVQEMIQRAVELS
jgi:hypothetical protein